MPSRESDDGAIPTGSITLLSSQRHLHHDDRAANGSGGDRLTPPILATMQKETVYVTVTQVSTKWMPWGSTFAMSSAQVGDNNFHILRYELTDTQMAIHPRSSTLGECKHHSDAASLNDRRAMRFERRSISTITFHMESSTPCTTLPVATSTRSRRTFGFLTTSP